MDSESDFLGVVGDPDIHDSVVLATVEQGDSVSVILERTAYKGESVGRATPRLEVRFVGVRDVESRREAGMVVYSLAELKGEPPWRRFVFTNWDDEDEASLEIWAQDVEWRDVERHPCPCCGFRTLDEAPPGTDEICPVCGWQDDTVQSRDRDFGAGPNRGQSLNECRVAFLDELSRDPRRADELKTEWGPHA